MKFLYSVRGQTVTVYTSERKTIVVEPGDVVETDDEKLIVRLQGDQLFSEVKPAKVPEIEKHVTWVEPVPKVKVGKRKKVSE